MAGRDATIVTNLRCNQACTYCNRRAPRDDRRFIVTDAVRARIRAATAAGATEITLSGGEPAMRSDLEALVAAARAAGAGQVALETNATLLDAPRARALRAAGLTRARVNLACWGDALDEITRDPGGFQRARAGIAGLATAGVVVDVVAPVIRSTLPHLPALPPALTGALGAAVRGLELVVPVEAPDPVELVDYSDAAEAVRQVAAAAWRAALPVALKPAHGLPPCVLAPPARDRFASLWALSGGPANRPGLARVDACGACRLSDACPGFSEAYRRRHPLPQLHPVRDEDTSRRFAMSRPAYAQIEHELVSRSVRAEASGVLVTETVIRVGFHCNQACAFCFVSTQLPPPRPAVIERAIIEAGDRGDCVVLSGGEPTLNPRLLDYVRLARRVSAHPVWLQTNAVLLAVPGRAAAVAEAGVGYALVSLHGATPEIAEAVTHAPGTLRGTLAGADALARAGVRLVMNFVICATNAHELPRVVELSAARWPGALVNVSFVAASTDRVTRVRELVPRYSDVVPYIREAVEAGRRLGVSVVGFDSMCGLPRCLVPDGAEAAALADLPPDFDGGEFVKPEVCGRCDVHLRCWGLRRSYADLHGMSEIRPIQQVKADNDLLAGCGDLG